MPRADKLFVLAVLLATAGLLLLGWFYYRYRLQVLGLPLGIGLVISALCGALLLTGDTAPTQQSTLRQPGFWRGLLWVLAVLPFVSFLGYPLGLALFVALYLTCHGHRGRVALVLALATLAVVYGGFMQLLRVPLPSLPWAFLP